MLDLTQETPLSLNAATKAYPPIDGKRPHVSTIWRWIRRGIRGVHLEHCRMGRRVVTSREALARFAQRLAEVDAAEDAAHATNGTASRPRTAAARDRDVARAEVELDAAGV